MFEKKGQGAMEYLMTYGWAILVVMIVGIVMWQMGIFNVGSTVPPRVTGFNFQKPLEATLMVKAGTATTNCGAAGGSCFELLFVNGEGGTITFTAFDVDVAGANIGACTVDGDLIAASPSVRQGAKYTLACPGLDAFTTVIGTGEIVVTDITMTYTVSIAGASRTKSPVGIARGPAE